MMGGQRNIVGQNSATVYLPTRRLWARRQVGHDIEHSKLINMTLSGGWTDQVIEVAGLQQSCRVRQ